MTRFTPLLTALGIVAATAFAPKAHGDDDALIFYATIDPNRAGEVLCALYDDEDSFLTRDVVVGTQTSVGDSTVATCRFEDVAPGTYAIAALHDEDGDEEMDKNLIGIPEEGYTTSRNAHLDGLMPDWEDARFTYRGDHNVQQGRMKY